MTNQLRSPLRSSLRSPFEHRRGGSAAFDPASLASSAFYDRTVMDTLFKNQAGSSQVTSTEQPIGLILDLAQGLAIGAEMVDTANSSSAWTPYGSNTAVQDGEAVKITHVGGDGAAYGAYLFLSESGGLSSNPVPGTFYMMTVDVRVNSGASVTVATKVNGVNYPSEPITSTENTKLSFSFVYQIGTLQLETDGTLGAGESIWFSNISMKELASYPQVQYTAGKMPITAGDPIYANFDGVDDELFTTFPVSLGAGCTVCRSLPGTGASITTGVTIGTTYTDNVDAHALLIFTAAQWADLSAGQISQLTAWLNKKAGL